MAEISLSIPTAGLVSPSDWYSRSQISALLENIDNKYRDYIGFASRTSRIPREIIKAFILVESDGNPTAGPAGHVTQGLMQWNRNHAQEQLEKELSQGRMSPAEKSKLAEFGIKFDAKGKTRAITNADQLKPELNILIGSIILGQLIDTNYGTDASGLRLDRVIVVYNSGGSTDSGKAARFGNYKTASQLAAVVNKISSAYIKKILGKDGALHVHKEDLLKKIGDVFTGKAKA
jgi:soluble lytic murein transglycosylase-like protein